MYYKNKIISGFILLHAYSCVNSQTIPATIVNNSKLKDYYPINGTNVFSDTWQGVCEILGYKINDVSNGKWCVNNYGNAIYVQGGDLCSDGSFRVPMNFDLCKMQKPACPNDTWTLSSDNKTCYKEDNICIVKTELFTEEKLLAGIVYGEASTQNNFEEMAAIASAVIRRRNATKQISVNTLVSHYKTYTYVVYNNNERFKKLMCPESQSDFELAYKAARNALSGGKDYANGGCFWDGYDLKTSGEKHDKYKKGFHYSLPEHNIFNTPENTHYIKGIAKGFTHTYESTAAYGKTIFWRYSTLYVLVMRATQCI